jgi:hypothetical protein
MQHFWFNVFKKKKLKKIKNKFTLAKQRGDEEMRRCGNKER